MKYIFVYYRSFVKIVTGVFFFSNAVSITYSEEIKTNISSTKGMSGMGTVITPESRISDSRTDFIITKGKRPGNGVNLFHSFDEFSIGNGDSAVFKRTDKFLTENIISRVTGQSPSHIDGLIRTQGYQVGVNLFLLNPQGIIFGENAKLDVDGAFHASTADYVGFSEDNKKLFVNESKGKSSLATTPIASFGFLNSPQKIEIKTTDAIGVDPGHTISIIGGDVTIEKGGLKSPGGMINIASAGSNGVIHFNNRDQSIFIQTDKIERFNKTTILKDANVDIRSTSGKSEAVQSGVVIIAKDIVIDGGEITAQASEDSTGEESGTIKLIANNFSLTRGASVAASTAVERDGGDIIVVAKNSVVISSSKDDSFGGPPVFSKISSTSSGPKRGNAGNIRIQSPELTLKDGGRILATSTGVGDAGNVELYIDQLKISEGGLINNETTGSGSGGTVSIRGVDGLKAANRLEIKGSPKPKGTTNLGRAGFNGEVESFPGGIESRTESDKAGGKIDLRAKAVEIDDEAQISAKSVGKDSGPSGQIRIIAEDSLSVSRGNSTP